MGRLWQQVILAGHHPAFRWVTVEELVRAHQADYYAALAASAAALDHFADSDFTRKDYLRLHPHVSAATASRDLQQGVARRLLARRGGRRTARYRPR